MTLHEDLEADYRRRYWDLLHPIASALEALLKQQLSSLPRIDRIVARAKSPSRFLAKAAKQLSNGAPRYPDPIVQIQDQIGARVIVHYTSDVSTVGKVVEENHRHIERRELVPDDDWKFGYVGEHYILALPTDAVPKPIPLESAPEFFELQIKTLWQHAWSEANHEIGYKSPDKLSSDQIRRLAFTAAQAWGADHIFNELVSEVRRDRH